MSDETQQIGRLSMRVEGTLWVAYYALPGTMDGALFLGSIRMAFVQDSHAKATFMALMRNAVGTILEEMTGVRPQWPNPSGVPAPEPERGGNA